MGTPIQQFVRRVLSPKNISQNLFKSPKSPLFNSPSVKLQPPSAHNFGTRCQIFQNSTNRDSNIFDTDLGISPIYENQNKIDDVKIKINGCENVYENQNQKTICTDKYKIPFFNTPERGKIMSLGLIEKNVSILGRGTFGTVIQGIYKDQIVAVKVISIRNNSLIREENALKLKHKNIVETLKIISEPYKEFGIVFMTNYPNSKNMQIILNDFNIEISKDKKLSWALEISEGLKYCHENEILHLDLKPKNILIGEDGICRLCDFGNSVNLKIEAQKKNYLLGTVPYTAPEIFRGENFYFKSDIYSLGITFWQIECREIPYKNIDNKDILIYEVVKNNLRPPKAVKETPFSKLYETCWSQNPNLRPDINFLVFKIKEISQG